MPQRYALNRTTDAASEPVTTAELKTHMNITAAFTEDDTYIATLGKAARYWVEDHTNRGLVNQSFTYNADYWPPGSSAVKLLRGPVSSVTSVKYKDVDGDQQTLVDGTDYQTDLVSIPARILPEPGTSWPNLEVDRANAVEIIFVAGYGATATSVTEDYKHAIKLLVAHWYEHREDASDGKPPQSIPMGMKQILSHSVMPLI